MEGLNAALAALGPWGILIGAVIAIAGRYLRDRMGPAPVSPDPKPSPAPAPSSTPILDAILQILRAKLSPSAPVQSLAPPEPADLSHDDAAELLLKLCGPKK